jgi:HAD superfamily hydrolase (TIGR01549 family)
MTDIKGILLDLNGVLEDTSSFEVYRDQLVVHTLREVADAPTVLTAAQQSREFLQAALQHQLPEFHLVFWEEILSRIGARPAYSRLAHYYERFLEAYLPISALYQDVPEFMEQVRPVAKLGVLSNANSLRARRFLEYHGLYDAFDAVTISHDTPCAKPQQELFHLAAARLATLPEETLMIGDRVDNDIAGAAGAGMRAVLLARGGIPYDAPPGITVVTNLREIAADVLQLPMITETPRRNTAHQMVAVVVCGGKGTRLANITHGRQKCLTDIHGRAILLYVIDRLLELGIRRFDFIAGASAAEVDEEVRPYLASTAEHVRVLPIIGSSTGESMATYWRDHRDPRRDVVYTHGNIIVAPEATKRLLVEALSARESDIVFLGSPEWMADTHAGLVSRNGQVIQIGTDVSGIDRRGLCSVGMAVIHAQVRFSDAPLDPKSMFEDVVERERLDGHLRVGCCFTDTPWEHLGTPADYARLNGVNDDSAKLRLLLDRSV